MSPSAPQYPLSGDLEHARRYSAAPDPSKSASPSPFPFAACSDSGTGHINGTRARSAFGGVAAYMDEAVVEAASALQRHGHQSRLNGKPSRWRHSPVRQRSGSGDRRTVWPCVRHSTAPRRPVDANPSVAQRGTRKGFDGGMGVVDSWGLCLPSVLGEGRCGLGEGGRKALRG